MLFPKPTKLIAPKESNPNRKATPVPMVCEIPEAEPPPASTMSPPAARLTNGVANGLKKIRFSTEICPVSNPAVVFRPMISWVPVMVSISSWDRLNTPSSVFTSAADVVISIAIGSPLMG